MSNGLNKPSARQAQKSLSDRLTTAEGNIDGLNQNVARALLGINQRFNEHNGRLITTEELVDALVDIQGREEVERLVDERRLERAEKLAAQEKGSLDQAISDGYVLAAEVAGEKSVIIGKYLASDGSVIPPGRAQLVMTGVQEQFRNQLLGKGVGTKLDLADGGKFELTEIYEVDDEKYQAFVAAKQAAAVNEAAQAAAAAASQETAEEAADDSGPVQ